LFDFQKFVLASMNNKEVALTVPLLDLKAQYLPIREEIRAAVDRVMDSQYFILGPEVEALERESAGYSQCEFGVGMSSGTDALLAALMAIELKPGDEVITTPYSFFATAGSVARLGGKPVFVDIDARTCNVDPDLIEASITGRTRAILPVHLFGQMADMDPIMEIAQRHGVYVIEDAAQAIGAEYKGRRAGSIGHLGCFSFYPSKNLGAFGDAGMVTTNDAALAERVKLLRNHGGHARYYHDVVGGNFRLDALQAAVLRVKFKYLDGWTEARRRNAATYRQLLTAAGLAREQGGSSEGGPAPICWLADAGYGRHIYNQFVITALRRDELQRFLGQKGIGTEVYYPVPLHLQDCFGDLGYRAGALPVSEAAAASTLALPIYSELTGEMQRAVVEGIGEFYNRYEEGRRGERREARWHDAMNASPTRHQG
jgi:dTDP-4-amino-4,6-dideoxygalactose transaminase